MQNLIVRVGNETRQDVIYQFQSRLVYASEIKKCHTHVPIYIYIYILDKNMSRSHPKRDRIMRDLIPIEKNYHS